MPVKQYGQAAGVINHVWLIAVTNVPGGSLARLFKGARPAGWPPGEVRIPLVSGEVPREAGRCWPGRTWRGRGRPAQAGPRHRELRMQNARPWRPIPAESEGAPPEEA